jgi:hypothetical protein
MKTYNTADAKLILEWVENYFKVTVLINNVFENLPFIQPMENELEYQRLRFWFLNNHDKFVPIWSDFCLSNGILNDLNENVRRECLKNPFLYYYPDNLLDLAFLIAERIANDAGYRDEKDISYVSYINKSFSCTTLHLANWIREFADVEIY